MGSPSCGRETRSYHTSWQNNDGYWPRTDRRCRRSAFLPLSAFFAAVLRLAVAALDFFFFADFLAAAGGFVVVERRHGRAAGGGAPAEETTGTGSARGLVPAAGVGLRLRCGAAGGSASRFGLRDAFSAAGAALRPAGSAPTAGAGDRRGPAGRPRRLATAARPSAPPPAAPAGSAPLFHRPAVADQEHATGHRPRRRPMSTALIAAERRDADASASSAERLDYDPSAKSDPSSKPPKAAAALDLRRDFRTSSSAELARASAPRPAWPPAGPSAAPTSRVTSARTLRAASSAATRATSAAVWARPPRSRRRLSSFAAWLLLPWPPSPRSSRSLVSLKASVSVSVWLALAMKSSSELPTSLPSGIDLATFCSAETRRLGGVRSVLRRTACRNSCT